MQERGTSVPRFIFPDENTTMPNPLRSMLLAALLISSHACLAAGKPGAGDEVVVSQGSATITFADVDAFAERIPEAKRPGFFDSPQRIETMLTGLLLQRQLADEARKLGIDKDPALAKDGKAPTDEALSAARIERFKADLVLPDFGKLAQEEYIAHKDAYAIPADITVQNVLVTIKDRGDGKTPMDRTGQIAAAKAIADKVAAEAAAHPDQFDALIDTYSDDPDKAAGRGRVEDAGNATKYAKEFATASRALQNAGDISPVTRTTYGFHVIKLLDRKPAQQRSFAEVKDEIIKRLRNEYVEKQVRLHTDTLRNLPMDANEQAVASLRTRYGAPAEIPPATKAKP